MKKIIPYIGTFLGIVAIIIAIVGGNDSQTKLGGTTNYDDLAVDSITVSGAGTITGASTLTGAATLSSTLSVAGLATLNAGQLKSYTNSTSTTATTQTLVQADILSYDTLLLTPNTGALTLTLPATSTLTSMVPTAGDRQELCIYNATSTAAATITLAAGAGMDLERVATSTTSGSTGVLAIAAQNYACLDFVRETDTDIGVLMRSYIDAD